MIELYETGSLAETQDDVCKNLANKVRDWMLYADRQELLKTTISEIVPPNPMIAREHDLTLHYFLKPITPHSGLSVDNEQLMARIHTHAGGNCEGCSLYLVSVPVDKDGEFQFPEKFSEWQVLYQIQDYVGVLTPDRTKPSEDEVTVCRILLEDALSTITEPEATHSIAA